MASLRPQAYIYICLMKLYSPFLVVQQKHIHVKKVIQGLSDNVATCIEMYKNRFFDELLLSMVRPDKLPELDLTNISQHFVLH